MLQVKSKVKVLDNSGARYGQVIKTYNKNSRIAFLNDKVLISVKELRLVNRERSKVKVGSMYFGILIMTRAFFKRKNNFYLRFDQNGVILLSKDYKPIGSRIFGIVPKELKEYKLFKLVSISNGTL